MAQSAARKSHNLKVVSSTLTGRKLQNILILPLTNQYTIHYESK